MHSGHINARKLTFLPIFQNNVSLKQSAALIKLSSKTMYGCVAGDALLLIIKSVEKEGDKRQTMQLNKIVIVCG